MSPGCCHSSALWYLMPGSAQLSLCQAPPFPASDSEAAGNLPCHCHSQTCAMCSAFSPCFLSALQGFFRCFFVSVLGRLSITLFASLDGRDSVQHYGSMMQPSYTTCVSESSMLWSWDGWYTLCLGKRTGSEGKIQPSGITCMRACHF